MPTTTTYTRVYVWQVPVRVYHWVNALAVTVLVATGLVIGRPPALMSAGEASSSFWFGTVRFLHFTAGFVFAFAFMVRAYWMVVGNEHARWDVFFPITPRMWRKRIGEITNVVKVDVLEIIKRPGHVVGHNALAAATYAIMFLLTIFQIGTGFALYAPMSQSWLPHLFAWVVPIFGSEASVRTWHHAAAWVFVVFTIVHVYLTVYHDLVEGRGEISSMVSGAKFVERT
jgi:Ni/Fe-hydrogenase 1 B-type cytochrome subunit